MITFHRRAVISPGHFVEAVRFASEVAAHVNSLRPDLRVTAGLGIGGQTGTVHWQAQYADMAALEDAQTQLFADEQYQQLLIKAADLLLPGSMTDDIVKSL